jgi:microcystin-dependent protein
MPKWAPLLLSAAVLALLPLHAVAVELGYGGRIVDATGTPLAGPVDVTVRFFSSETDGDLLGTAKTFAKVPLREGVFQLSIAFDVAEQGAIFGDASRPVFIELEALGKVYPRQRFTAVPLALRTPVDSDTLAYGDDGKLAVRHVSIGQVTGLTEALSSRPSETPASGAVDGYLAAVDWTRFDAKQDPITASSTVEAGSLTTAQQSGLFLKPYGSAIGETGELRFAERTGGNFVGFKAPDAITGDQVWTLPASDGSSGQVLATDGAGSLAWKTLGGADIVDGSLTDADVSPSAAIADDKLATISTAGKVSGSAMTSGTIGGTATFAGSGGIATAGAIMGTGNFNVMGTGAAATELRFGDNDNSNYVGFKAPAVVAANNVWTLPAVDGSAGQFLSTNGAGTLSWGSPAGGGDMLSTANLADLSDVSAARSNLGLGPLATLSAVGSTQISDGSIADADVATTAAIATAKLSGAVTQVAGHGLGSLASLSAIGSGEISDGTIANADISATAAIATSKLSGGLTAIAGHGLGAIATLSAVGSSEITDGSIADADVAATAAIATSKISGALTSIAGHGLGTLASLSSVGSTEITDGAVTSSDIADGTIADTDISGSAAIATSKLSGAVTSINGHGLGALATMSAVTGSEITDGAIADADVSGTAAIATSKLSGAITSVSGHGLGSLATMSAVGSSEITDGAIIDADIASTAAISSSKIDFAADSVSGNAVDGGVISNFQSTGIDDDALGVAMTIKASGSVGIGTTSPNALLSFGNGSVTKAVLHTYDGGAGVRHGIGIQANETQFFIPTSAPNHFSFNAGGDLQASGTNELMRITSAGNVGIGTSAPTGKLTVSGTIESTSGGFKFPDGTTLTSANAADTAGTVKLFAMANPPTGWLACNGAAVSRSTYATLFATIGTTYGTGDGSTTFNLPNSSTVPLTGGASAGYRYYRVRLTSKSSGAGSGEMCIYNIQFRADTTWLSNNMTGYNTGTIGSYNATISYGSEYSSSHASWYAFDSNAGTSPKYCTAGGTFSATAPNDETSAQWLMVDFGSGNAPLITGYKLYAEVNYAPDSFYLQRSSDGSSWTTITESSQTGQDVSTEKTYTWSSAGGPLGVYAIKY